MAHKTSRKIPPKPPKEPMPNFPQHQFEEPYARLMTLGLGDFDAVYEEVASELRRGDTHAAVEQLVKMALDETYYDYWDEDADETDPRSWTKLHALRVLKAMGPAAVNAVEPLLPLLEYDEDDYIAEEMPGVYGAIGGAAIEPLTKTLHNHRAEQSQRISAGEALAEIGEIHEDLRPRIITILEQGLVMQTDDPELAGFLITNLMDVGARESMPLIAQMFHEGRVDEMVVQMADVEEHFGLPRVTPYKDWRELPSNRWDAPGPDDPIVFGLDAEEMEDEEEAKSFEPAQERGDSIHLPYIAPPKVGRNDLCPCGSGKKYKKCCGA